MQSSLIEVNFIGGLRELGQASWPSRFFLLHRHALNLLLEIARIRTRSGAFRVIVHYARKK